jgi:hypothetical protein
MFYLIEKLNLPVATAKNLDRFIEIESGFISLRAV